MVKARECDLDKVKREDIEVTELICGTNDPKLREEILKMKDPKLVDIVALGHQFDTAAKLQKSNFNDDETKVNKTTSEYKKSQNDNWQRGRDQNQNPKCGWCGGPTRHKRDKSDCPAKDSTCTGCGMEGHWKVVCRNSQQKRSQTPGPNRMDDSKAEVHSKTVRCGRVKIVKEDDFEAREEAVNNCYSHGDKCPKPLECPYSEAFLDALVART